MTLQQLIDEITATIKTNGTGAITGYIMQSVLLDMVNYNNDLIDTDVTLSANSDLLIPSQKAVKSYVDNITVNVEYEIYFPSSSVGCDINCNDSITFLTVDKGEKIDGLSYSLDDGSNWVIATLTLVSGNLYSFDTPIAMVAGTTLKLRVDSFLNSKTDGTLIIKGEKT